ncbi:uncharacterized protein Tco025E_02764 [Trypanosoma conorhini]|uniref:Uncharacterized protein n=1 Tax=Trypanosoma conorhini TaxID=83891 RepID=A0A3R7PDL7_9TRYP|nr:uncharacterized protein Tco025E_02764 [Trypanosoma conorhini]RNF23791.1 hypothetical protein Tco025E_02764 [Trypanosoma conorhini]
MRPSGLSNRHERELAGSEPVLIGVGRAEAQLRREMDGVTSALLQRQQQRWLAFGRERAAVRARVDRGMGELLDGVEGVVPPCVLDPPILAESPCPPLPPPQQVDARCAKREAGVLPLAALSAPAGGKRALVPYGDNSGKLRVAAEELTFPQVCFMSPGGKGAPPRGFPSPFESSGFQCVTHWAETSLQEVLLTALGPRSQRERRNQDEPNGRLLVGVACYLLNELLIREPKLSRVWPQLREVIFRAIFQPPVYPLPPGVERVVGSSYPPFEGRQAFEALNLWSGAFLASRAENARLSQRIEDLKSVVEKSRLILRFAQRRVDEMLVGNFFRAWRKSTQRQRCFRDSATAYFTRMRQRIRLEVCFLRWRRVSAQSQVAELLKMVKESEVRLAFLEGSNTKQVNTLLEQLKEEQKANAILELKKETLKSQLAEGHVIALRAIDNELQQQQANILMAKKQGKRWERLAKTFSCSTKFTMVPPSLRKLGVALRRVEEQCALRIQLVNDWAKEARRSLELFLLEWVNCFMKTTMTDVPWHPVVKISTGFENGDFGPGALLQLVRALESAYLGRGVHCAPFPSSAAKREESLDSVKADDGADASVEASNDALFTELRRLLYLQTMEGLYPPLLSCCTFLESFFGPAVFCRVPHPTAMLWVLASLFVGYTRLACGDAVQLEHGLDAALRCPEEAALQNYFLMPRLVANEAAATKDGTRAGYRGGRRVSRAYVISNNTTIQKHPRSRQWRGEFARKRREEEEMDEAAAKDRERLADTLSDLEVYLGLDDQEDEDSDSSSSSEEGGSAAADSNAEGTGTALSTAHASSDTRVETPKQNANALDEERQRRVNRKARLVPPMNESMCSFSLREFVEYHHRAAKQRRVWMGLSRVVSSLVVRFCVLDVGAPVPEEPRPLPNRRSSTSRPRPPSVSNRTVSIRQSRRSIRLLPSFS